MANFVASIFLKILTLASYISVRPLFCSGVEGGIKSLYTVLVGRQKTKTMTPSLFADGVKYTIYLGQSRRLL